MSRWTGRHNGSPQTKSGTIGRKEPECERRGVSGWTSGKASRRTNESLERLSLVLIGMAIGVLFGAIIQSQSHPLTEFDILITVILLVVTVVLLREGPYKK